MRLPEETIADLNNTDRAWELLAPWDVRPDNATLERHTVYTFQARWADIWRRGRLLIAGDAAHLMPPFAGQGMCAGLRDAMNLTWKLDRVLRGTSPDGLLNSYTPERTPHVRGFIDFSMELGKVICLTDPAAATERDRLMMAVLQDPSSASPVAGTVSIQAPVSGLRASGLLDDVLGGGACLLLSDPALLSLLAPHRELLDQAGLPLVAFAPEPSTQTVVDTTGAYQAWLQDLDAIAVLIRPDFAVYGTAATPAAVVEMVKRYHDGLNGTATDFTVLDVAGVAAGLTS